jgi:hypothetical protein
MKENQRKKYIHTLYIIINLNLNSNLFLYLFFLVYPLINRRRFQQMDVLESINILVTISGKKNKVRVYYLNWLKNKIVKTEPVSQFKLILKWLQRMIFEIFIYKFFF